MQLGREVCLRLLVRRKKLVHGKFGEIAVGVIRATRWRSSTVHGGSRKLSGHHLSIHTPQKVLLRSERGNVLILDLELATEQ